MAELKKYYADNHNALLLENIMQFAANINLKDKDAEDAAETDQSRFFRDILKKYNEDRLNFSDIVSLKKFIDRYNAAAKSTVELIFTDKDTNELLSEIFKLSIQTIDSGTYLYDISTDKRNSFLTNLQAYIKSLIDVVDNGEDDDSGEDAEPQDDGEEESEPEVEQRIKEFENEKDYSIELIEFVNGVITADNNSAKITELCNTILNNTTYPKGMTSEKIDDIKPALRTAIENYIRVYLLNYFIQFSIDFYTANNDENKNILDVTVNKDCPDQYERDDVVNEYSVTSIITSFDLKTTDRINIANEYFKIQDNSISLNNTYAIRFNVVYKELNPYRREIGSSSLFESIISTALLQKYQSASTDTMIYNGLLDNILFTWVKEQEEDVEKGIITKKRPIYSFGSNIMNFICYGEWSLISMKNQHVYTYSSPIRNIYAEPTDIVSFFCGDTEISHGFGSRYISGYTNSTYIGRDFEAVREYLSLFTKFRDIFYKNLYNYSFAEDPRYVTYIKLFIITESIKQWLDIYKMTGKNLEQYTEEDYNNFLYSAGLTSIANAPSSEISSTIKKTIVSNYSNLMANKGTNAAILIINNIIRNTGLMVDYKKYFIGQNIGLKIQRDENGNAVLDGNKNFISILEKDENDKDKNGISFFPKEILSSDGVDDALSVDIDKLVGIPYSSFLNEGKDRYWTVDSVKESLLKKLDIDITNTKYISLQVSQDSEMSNQILEYILGSYYYEYKKYTSANDSYITVFNSSESTDAEYIMDGMSWKVKNTDVLNYLTQILWVYRQFLLATETENPDQGNPATIAENPDQGNDSTTPLYPGFNLSKYNNFTDSNGKKIDIKNIIRSGSDIMSEPKSLKELMPLIEKSINRQKEELVKSYTEYQDQSNIETKYSEIETARENYKNITELFSVEANLYADTRVNEINVFNNNSEDTNFRTWFRQNLIENGVNIVDTGSSSIAISLENLDNFKDSVARNRYNNGQAAPTEAYANFSKAITSMSRSLRQALTFLNGADTSKYFTLFAMQENEEIEKLIEALLRSFISYTTEIYKIQYFNMWDSELESAIPSDGLAEVRFSSTRSDIMAFDDSLEIYISEEQT